MGLDVDGPPGLSCLEAALGRGSTFGARETSKPYVCPAGITPQSPSATEQWAPPWALPWAPSAFALG